MTDHIEEARKLEPLGHISEYGFGKLKTRRNYCVSISHQAEKEYTIGVCLLSDAQAALAAAEERGRIEERELCNQIVRAAWGQNVTIEVLSDAITKEPTP